MKSRKAKATAKLILSEDLTQKHPCYKEYSVSEVTHMEYTQEEIKEILLVRYPNTTREEKEELARDLGYKNSSTLRTVASRLGVSAKYITPDLEGETWKTIENFPDYLISNKGRIKSKNRNNLISTRVHAGYYDCRIKDQDGNKKSPRIHRLVAEEHVDNPNPEKYTVVNHIDGDKLNNIADNLEWCTVAENNQHALENIVFDYSNNNPRAHLTTSEAEDICKRVAGGQSIADIMGVSERYTRARVEKIRQRKTYTEISEKYEWG